MDVTKFIVRADDGSVDETLSHAAFATALTKHIAERETETSTIATAVGEVFDQYLGTSINMPALCNFACAKLNAQPENYKVLSERVAAYVRDNAQGKDTSEKDAKESIWERPDSMFVIGKGKGGGVYRRIDHVEKPTASK